MLVWITRRKGKRSRLEEKAGCLCYRVGNICKQLDIDSHEVMRIFCMDKHLNISPYYFRPGFAYGGSCLPKDLKGLKTLAHDLYLETPVLNAIEYSNEIHIAQVTHKDGQLEGLSGRNRVVGRDPRRGDLGLGRPRAL